RTRESRARPGRAVRHRFQPPLARTAPAPDWSRARRKRARKAALAREIARMSHSEFDRPTAGAGRAQFMRTNTVADFHSARATTPASTGPFYSVTSSTKSIRLTPAIYSIFDSRTLLWTTMTRIVFLALSISTLGLATPIGPSCATCQGGVYDIQYSLIS